MTPTRPRPPRPPRRSSPPRSRLAGDGPLVFAGVQHEPTAAALAGWIRAHARTAGREPMETLPLSLRAHLIA